jgi:hypothetical protein
MRTPLSAAYISELPTSLFCLVPAPSAWHRGAGLRIDHRLLSPATAGKLVDAGVDRHVRGWGEGQRPCAGADRDRGTASEDEHEALNWRGRRRLSLPASPGRRLPCRIDPISATLAWLFALIMGYLIGGRD